MGDFLKIQLAKDIGGDLGNLKNCPFCGGDNIAYGQYDTAVGVRWKIICLSCMAMIDPGYARQRETVARMWNHRADKENAPAPAGTGDERKRK